MIGVDIFVYKFCYKNRKKKKTVGGATHQGEIRFFLLSIFIGHPKVSLVYVLIQSV